MFKKYLKIVVISSFVGFGLAYLFVKFFSYNIKKELAQYEQRKIHIQALADSYALCVGLYNANPSKQREELCNYIKEKVYIEVKNIEGKYPYTSLYQKVFN